MRGPVPISPATRGPKWIGDQASLKNFEGPAWWAQGEICKEKQQLGKANDTGIMSRIGLDYLDVHDTRTHHDFLIALSPKCARLEFTFYVPTMKLWWT